MDDNRDPAATFARARVRADRALASAAWAGEAGARAERYSRQGPASLSKAAARLAAILRSSQRHHVAAAQLNAAYAARRSQSMDQPGGSRGAALLAAVACAGGGGSVVVNLSGRGRPGALVAASDALAQAACDLERGYGEGPAMDAVARVAQVEASGDLAAVWPLYGPAAGRLGVHAVSAAPLCLHGRCLGSVTVLNASAGGPRAGRLADTLVYTLLAGSILADRDRLPGLSLTSGDRAINHAAGMVAAQSGLAIPDAFALIRARAFADSQPVETIAARIVSRQLHLTI